MAAGMMNMELVITLLALFVAVGVVVYAALVKSLTRRLPPGSFGLPVLGETLDFVRSIRENSMGEFVQKRQAKHGAPVFRTSLFFNKVVVMGGPEESRFLFGIESKHLRDWFPAHFLRLIGHHTIMVQSGPHHRHLRRLAMMCLGPQALQSFAPTLDRLTRQHLAKHWRPVAQMSAPGNQLRAHPLMQEHMLDLAAAFLLGLHDRPTIEELAVFFPDFLAGSNIGIPLNIPGTRFHKAVHARAQLDILLSRIMAKRRAEIRARPASEPQLRDLLSIFVSSTDEHGQPFCDLEILSNLITFLFAGHDTTASTMATMCKFLATHPECMEQVIQEHKNIANSKADREELTWEDVLKMNYTWMVVQETLRLQPSCIISFKDVLDDFVYKGYKIPKGYKVMHHLVNSHFDEKLFPNGKEFNPLRFAEPARPRGSFMPFNGGAHVCPGMQFAQMASLVFFHYLVRQFEFSLVDPYEKISYEPLPTPENGLLLRIEQKDTDINKRV